MPREKNDGEPTPTGHTLRGLIVFGGWGAVLLWSLVDDEFFNRDMGWAGAKFVLIAFLTVLLVFWLRERFYKRE